MCLCVCIFMDVCVCVYVCGCVYVYVCVCVCACMYMCICIHACLYVYVCVNVCMCVCVYLQYVYVYVYVSNYFSNKPSKINIRTFINFNNRTFECGKYTFVSALRINDYSLENSYISIRVAYYATIEITIVPFSEKAIVYGSSIPYRASETFMVSDQTTNISPKYYLIIHKGL